MAGFDGPVNGLAEELSAPFVADNGPKVITKTVTTVTKVKGQ